VDLDNSNDRGIAIVDSHVHVWTDGSDPYPYGELVPPPDSPIFVEQLIQQIDTAGVSQAILVQPSVHGYDNRYIANCVRRYPRRFVGVCRVNPSKQDAADKLFHLVQEENFRGLRLNLRQESDYAAWDHKAIWEAAAALKIAITLLLDPPQLVEVAAVAQEFSTIKIVIDHLARIILPREDIVKVQKWLLALAVLPNVYVKLSAFHILSHEPFPWTNLHPLIHEVNETYGSKRLMWASDFPLDAELYTQSLRFIQENPEWNNEDRRWLLRDTASSVFGLPPWPLAIDV
jgi:L-fuconolactonase